jgi:hypothetical protein
MTSHCLSALVWAMSRSSARPASWSGRPQSEVIEGHCSVPHLCLPQRRDGLRADHHDVRDLSRLEQADGRFQWFITGRLTAGALKG